MNTDYILQMIDIKKDFSGTTALKAANFSLIEGEVHALVGGNGAGKSSLMKVLTGVYLMDSGTLKIDNKVFKTYNVQEAKKHGISMVFQEFSLIPTLTVAQNIFLGQEPLKAGFIIDDKWCVGAAEKILKKLDMDINANVVTGSLGVEYLQIIEIAKALSRNARILILDKPTSSLSESEKKHLFKFIKSLKQKGISIIYITHRLQEIF